jgi:two-component system response regulator FixJ
MHLIAVVDDEEPVRRSVERLLRGAGYDVATFGSGAELLNWLNGARPACVLVDLHMPGMGGMEVLSHLARQPVPIPAIVVSGRASSPDRQMAADLGAVAFFAKPFDPSKLLDAAASVVKGRPVG